MSVSGADQTPVDETVPMSVGGLEQVPDLKPLLLAGEMARARAEGAQAVLLQARGFVCTPTPPDAVPNRQRGLPPDESRSDSRAAIGVWDRMVSFALGGPT